MQLCICKNEKFTIGKSVTDAAANRFGATRQEFLRSMVHEEVTSLEQTQNFVKDPPSNKSYPRLLMEVNKNDKLTQR